MADITLESLARAGMTASDLQNYRDQVASGGPVIVYSPNGTPTWVSADDARMLMNRGYHPATAAQAGEVKAPSTSGPVDGKKDDPNQQRIDDLQRQLDGLRAGQQQDSQRQQMNAIEAARAAFPWAEQIGLLDQIKQFVIDGFDSGDALVAKIRGTSQWANFFQGIRRPNGELRMNEATYIQQKNQVRQLFKQYGRPDYEYDDPSDFKAFFESEQDPNELKQRLDVYDKLRNGAGQEVKDAFYVYAGMKLSDDDLYNAIVLPDAGRQLTNEYQQRATLQPLDYATWITRATEVGLDRVVKTLQDLQGQGAVTNQAIYEVQRLSPDFARQMMDVLYHGGNPAGGEYLNLQELLNSFEMGLIGGAAVGQGLALPTAERVQAIRAAGVDRTKALEAYSQYASQQNLVQGMVDRLNQDRSFGQSDFEKAVFLQSAPEAELLRRAQAGETALGAARSGSNFGVNNGRLLQSGLVTPGI